MNNLKNEINDLIQSIDQTTLLFYQQHTKEAYQQLDQMLMLLMQTMTHIAEYNRSQNIESTETTQMNQILDLALKALEKKDTILFSDIMRYELELILNKIGNTLK